MAHKPASASGKTSAKSTRKGSGSAVGARSGQRAKSNSPDRSKRAKAPAGRASKAKNPPAPQEAPLVVPGSEGAFALPRPKRGRPKDTPEVWTPEHVEAVADLLWAYVEAIPIPSLSEFCFRYGIRRQRLYEHPELCEVKDYLYAKRAAALEAAGIRLTRDDGPRGAFLIRALANVGEYSMVEKTENTEHVQSVNVYLPDNGRGDGPKPEKRDA